MQNSYKNIYFTGDGRIDFDEFVASLKAERERIETPQTQ
jgi:hypothetical protein